MKGNLHETVSKLREKVGLPLIPFAEGKVPGTGLSLAVSEYMQGVSNPQMPEDTCPRCGHTTCPPDCDCEEPDCPGHRANARMSGVAHEVSEGTVVEIDGDKVTIWKDNDPPASEHTEADVSGYNAWKLADQVAGQIRGFTGIKTSKGSKGGSFSIDYQGHKYTANLKQQASRKEKWVQVRLGWFSPKRGIQLDAGSDRIDSTDTDPRAIGLRIVAMMKRHAKKVGSAEKTDPIKDGILKTQNLLKGGGVDEATKELKSGLGKWLERAREAKKVGNHKRAVAIMKAIEAVVTDKELDERTVYDWNETFDGALTPEYNRSDFSESINDRNLFKAVFLAGGPGAGKSFIAGGMFKGTGARFVNTDIFFEHLLKKKGLPFVVDSSKKVMYGKQMIQRGKAKKLVTSQAGHWVNGMLPLVVDGTGKDLGKIKKQKQALEKLGYDTSMVFVNTTLEVALQRNQMRKRKVPEEIVKKGWDKVQKNIGQFQSLFSGNMIIVDNSEAISGAGLGELKVRLARSAMKMLSASLKNRMGSNTIAALQRQGGKYITDIDPDFDKKAIGL